ncbi:hypothetical protein DL771_003484 [Monosporascus sp. 5C6A]|nr:hypothetical protein DL771_003484 [Monosporascus sp. 5C6A]
MKFETNAAVVMMLGVAAARPDAMRMHKGGLRGSAKFRREVPQEHSHDRFVIGVKEALNLNNVDQVQDPIFALLGNAAAAQGAGLVEDLDCLQQRVADQAFTNAKEAGDLEGMTNALIFRTLERNTAAVGQKSVLCQSEVATNPEIAALQQHQDPASEGAAELNKNIALELAVQLASIGADPQLALLSGTFEPGDVNDRTGAGNTCDDLDDPIGCIFTKNLLVEDATPEEIDAAVAGAGGEVENDADVEDDADANDECVIVDDGADADDDAAVDEDNADDQGNAGNQDNAGNQGNAGNQDNAGNQGNAGNEQPTPTSGVDVNAFTGTVGAAPIPIISSAADRPFEVNGATFQNIGAAAQRACDVQKNQCANAANSGEADLDVAACDAQQQECIAANANNAARRRRRGASFERR